ncbi:hypothetical protein SAMN05192558_11022 [Actinokineospora alba]|uniref:Uncharacterized protein n=1 Tax=Actinokineospora alba TaxID=504798 RepID=A0A1H0TJF3_9PSEU|nr:hypothetical protein [Actinokineospora alba]TDP70553.1 hypothetical protein C8E96_6172 [Actinokineospora alba]SDJ09902.1 hypothetical protein SAMN05421871_11022 [Actinokineospora alba]SDP54153.1 hypothetical protein SAMN05192558_11022 [Actinokineospora alba]
MTEEWRPYVAPPRDLPDDVRDRIRTRALGEAAGGRRRTPLAVAAVVALLVAGGSAAVDWLAGVEPPANGLPGPEVDMTRAQTELDRCWAAVVDAGKAARFPHRATWRPVIGWQVEGRWILAARSGETPIFCETTTTSVTVADPKALAPAASGTGTAALLFTPAGSVAGVADPTWSTLFVDAESGGPTVGHGTQAMVKDGMWVGMNPLSQGPMKVSATAPIGDGGPPEVRNLPTPAAPAVSVVDRPLPAGERASSQGAFLGECLTKSETPVVDPDAWQPGAMTSGGAKRTVVARLGDLVASCTRDYDAGTGSRRFSFSVIHEEVMLARPIQFVTLVEPEAGESAWAIGAVEPEVSGMKLTMKPGAEPISVPIIGSTFALPIPQELMPQAYAVPTGVQVVVTDRNGKEIHSGQLFPG